MTEYRFKSVDISHQICYNKIVSGTAPIAKNSIHTNRSRPAHIKVTRGQTPIEKNVIVTDEFGKMLTCTYPKRAKGLIKKGRAEQVGENEIRLKGCSVTPCLEDNMNNTNFTDNTNDIGNITIDAETGEVIEKAQQAYAEDNYTIHGYEPKIAEISEGNTSDKPKQLFFNAREWTPSKECDKTVFTRSFISDPFGNLTEAYTIGDWNYNWSQIETKDLILEKNTDYEFVFWLNGGENDRNNEVCRFEIMFDNDYDGRYVYNLNRHYIKYLKHYKGWYLYSIPFNTGDACYTKLRFISQASYTTIIKANSVESYDNLPEDIPPQGLPQRHNIWFSEGFPRNAWWSSKAFPDMQNNDSEQERETHFDEADFSGVNGFADMGARISKIMQEKFGNNSKYSKLAQTVRERIEEELEDELDPDDLADELMDEIDVDSIREQIIQQIKDSL